MAQCSRCGADTELHFFGKPICLRYDSQEQPTDLNPKGAASGTVPAKKREASA
jgi:hypothetical protein